MSIKSLIFLCDFFALFVSLPFGLVDAGLFDHNGHSPKLDYVPLSDDASFLAYLLLLVHALKLMKITECTVWCYNHKSLPAKIL